MALVHHPLQVCNTKSIRTGPNSCLPSELSLQQQQFIYLVHSIKASLPANPRVAPMSFEFCASRALSVDSRCKHAWEGSSSINMFCAWHNQALPSCCTQHPNLSNTQQKTSVQFSCLIEMLAKHLNPILVLQSTCNYIVDASALCWHSAVFCYMDWQDADGLLRPILH